MSKVQVVCGSSLFAISVVAAAAASAQPLPDALIAARSVYIVNSGVSLKDAQRAAKVLQEWGRWSVVSNPETADIKLTITRQANRTAPNFLGGADIAIDMAFYTITDKHDNVLYGDETGPSNPSRMLGKLRKAIERQAR